MTKKHLTTHLATTLIALSGMKVLADAPKPATMDEFNAEPALVADALAEFKGTTYGFVITKKGFIRALHDASGKIIFDSIGDWVLQRNGNEHAGWINDRDTEVSVSESDDGSLKTYSVEIIHPKVIQRTKIACRESGPDITADFEIVDFANGVGLNFPVKLNHNNVESSKPDPKENPVPFSTDSGSTLSIGYSSENFSPYGSKGNGAYVPNRLGLSLYPKFQGASTPGSKDTINLDIQVP